MVDADADTRAVLSSILRYCGALVWEAASTEAALTSIAETIPGVVVTTLRPPRGSAAALRERLRALPPEQRGKTPVIAVGPSSEADAARTSGCDAYLAVPIDAWALCELVSELTNEWGSR